MEANLFSSNQMDDEKSSINEKKQYWEGESINGKVLENGPIEIIPRKDEEKIPEIKDIYDHIYGNVQSKRVFYEGKKGNFEERRGSNVTSPRKNNDQENLEPGDFKHVFEHDSLGHENLEHGHVKKTSMERLNTENIQLKNEGVVKESREENNEPTKKVNFKLNKENPDQKRNANLHLTLLDTFDDKSSLESAATSPSNCLMEEINLMVKNGEDDHSLTPVNSPVLEKKPFCPKCLKSDFVSDRSEILTEINANLKLELEHVKQSLKKEMLKNNELNFEIANIEASLEAYYNEAKHQKSTLSSIYSAMKNYVSDQKEFQESYTYKRIKMIADYMESLKKKLEHQDHIIKTNFVENPYYADLLVRHGAVLRQLDDLSKENLRLQEELKTKSFEEVETIKELTRQKCQLETRCNELEDFHRGDILRKDMEMKKVEEEYQRQLDDLQDILEQKKTEMVKIRKVSDARVSNYKQELVIVYRKWKEMKMKISQENA